MDRPVLLCGLGRIGLRILEHLRAAGIAVTVVDTHAEEKAVPCEGVTVVQGDCRRTDVLERAGVRNCAGAIIVTSDDLVNVTTALLVRRLNAETRIVVRMFNQNLLARLGGAVTNTVALSVSALTAPLLALTAVTGNAITAVRMSCHSQQIASIAIEPGSTLVGQSLASLAAEHTLHLLAHSTSLGESTLWDQLDHRRVLQPGDAVYACGAPEAMATLLAVGRDELLGSVRWAGWVRRQLRTLRRTLLSVDRPMKVAGALLAVTLIGTAIIFRQLLRLDWPDAFYETVGLIATGDDLRKEDTPNWVKVYFGTMKLMGTALIAGFTAIFTQYLIRAKFGGALEARRIPDGGHVVVCGLGNVGFRCVEELVRLNRPVVAVDAATDNPFAATVRRWNVPVIVGNATVAEVLTQARVATAGAVIAATDSDLSNLEIALLVRETNAKQRVVLRLNEPNFADAVRDSANIRHAMAIPALAAPAFTAALFGDRVQSLITVGTRTLAVLEIVVGESETHLLARSVRDVAETYTMLPLCLNEKTGDISADVLEVGDVLTVIIELKTMDRMIRSQTESKSC